MSGVGKKPLKIIPLEKRLMLDASLAGLISSIVIAEDTSNAAEQVIDNDVTVAGTTTDFDGENLIISTSGGVEDQLSIVNEGTGAGQIGVSGTDISYEGTIIGTLSSDGSNGSDLQIDLNASASKAAIERLIENVTYQNTSDAPAPNRTITMALGLYFSETVDISVAPENDAPVAGNNTGITVAEGATIGITSAELSVTDGDHTAAQLTYTVTDSPNRGQLELNTNPGVSVTSFTQADIDAGRLVYVHDNTESTFDKFNFTVTDGTDVLAESTFNITVNVVDDVPTITTNSAVDVSLGFSTTIGGTADDFGTQVGNFAAGTFGSFEGLLDNQDTQMRIVFTTPATLPDAYPGEVIFETGGSGRGLGLFLNENNELTVYAGAATSTPRLVSPISLEANTQYAIVLEVFTGSNEMRLSYEQAANHDWFYEGRDAEALLTGFTENDISGSDGGGIGQPNAFGAGNYGGFNGTPSGTTTFQGSIDSNLIVTRTSGSIPTANDDLVVTDSNDPAGSIVYTVTDVTDYGTLLRDGVALGLNDTFTQADLNKGLITYDSTSAPPGPGFQDGFGFSVSDGTTTLNDTFTINVDTVNAAPTIYDEVVIYDEDFTGGTSGWNNNTTATHAVMGEFWGRFNRNIDQANDQDLFQTFALSGVQEYVTIEFDFFEIDTWDNEELFFFVDDTRYTIGNNIHQGRFDRPADINNINIETRITELSNQNGWTDLGRDVYRDQFYHYQITIPVSAASVKLGFGTNLNSTNLNDESFGIDNIQISELRAVGAGTREVSISETVINGNVVTTVEAGDPDGGQTLAYSITGGTGVGVFDIDAATGIVTVIDATQIDFETMPTTYTLDVQVQDNGPGLLTDTQTLTINILDAFENSRPDITYTTFSIPENITNGSTVGTLPFTDPQGDGIERWQIIDGNELGIFTINATTGEVTVADGSQINFESDNRYDLRIRGWDDNFLGLYDDQTMRVNITNVDDAPSLNPEFIGENSGVPNVVYSADTGNFYRFIDSNANYATALANAEAAMLNGASGHLLTIESAAEKAFVRSIADQHLWLGIGDMAQEGVWRYTSGPNEGLQLWQGAGSNSGGSATNGFYTDWRNTAEPNNGTAYNGAVFYRNDGRWVDVPVGNNYRYMIEWEGTDVVNNDTYYLNYDAPTDLNNGDAVGTVQGLDPEGDTLTYSIQGGTGAALFNLDPTTGAVTIANAAGLDPNIDYTLTVRATEDNGTNQFAETTITIVLNENLSIDANNGHTATEGLTTTITPAELTVTDGDGVATDIIFDIDTFPANGQLELSTNPGTGIIEFTLDDLNNNRVRYVHDGSETLTDSFTFNVTDGGQTLPLETFNITITPVNDAPTINVNTGTPITEGGTVVVTSTMLDSLDVDNTDTQLTYTASGYVLGQIEVSGVVQNTFTQDDINNNRVVFRHDGNEGATASFNLSLADTGGLTDTATFNMAVTAVNDAPVVGTNTGFSVLEGGTYTITTAELSAVDPDDSGTGLSYNLSNISGGQLQLSTSPGVPILSFTHADLVANRVRFIHDGSEQNASFDVEVADGGEDLAATDTATVNVTRIPVNDAPDFFRNLGSSVNEGSITLIKTAVLTAIDPDNVAADLTYTISNEVNGQVELLSNLGVAITSFTQADLENSQIVFRHDGSSTLVASFDMQLDDGALTSAVATYNLSVDNVNDAPVISTGPAATVLEGQNVAITTAELDSFDPDNIGVSLVYTVSNATNGFVALSSDLATPITTFNQVDLDNGLIRFIHDGSDTVAASFDVSLSDGALTDVATVNLNVTPQNDEATLIVNDGDPNVINLNDYTIDPHEAGQDGAHGHGSVANVSPDGSTLSLSGNVWKKIDIPYTLTANTVLSLEFRTDAVWEIQGIGFDTDTSVGNGVFGYQLAGSQIWGGTDQSFRNYQVGDGWVRYDIPIGSDFTGVIANLTFIGDNDAGVGGTTEFRNINFYESGAILDLNEGSTFNITTAHINSVDPDDSGIELTYNATNLRNGNVQVSGVNAASFTQDDLDNNRVTFVHDGSETLSAGFDIELVDGLEHGAVAQNDTFNLIINPVNDDTVINTNNPITLAENATATISSADLNITDTDNSPHDVVITVTSAPSDGRVVLANDLLTPIGSFTLAQLNAGDIRYVHNGAENATDAFDFTVTDGTYTSGTQQFDLNITPVNDAVILATNAGTTVGESGNVTITNAMLNTTDTDNAANQITYTVTDLTNGWVELTTDPGFPVSTFTQDDINNNRVVFRHDGSGANSAAFDFSVTDGGADGAAASTGTFNLGVNAPVNEGPVVAITDGAPTTIDFSSSVISAYDAGGAGDGQGVSPTDYEVSSDGSVLTLWGNSWKKIPLPMTVTADTTLTFDFRSTKEGEIHSIGFDNNDTITDSSTPAGAFFELFGTDPNGLFNQGYNTYSLGDGWTRFEIPVGATFTGAVTDLFFSADDDASSDAISQFRNVSVYEANPTITMNEGGTLPLTNANLNVFDVDQTPANLTYNVTSTTNGHVELNGVLSTNFTQDDINNGRVTFIHDGTETVAADFDFTVTDGTVTTASETLSLTVTPVNDAVTLTLNTGATVNEAGNIAITNLMLDTSDSDSAASDITYTANSISNGHIEVGGVVQNTFTQVDIDNGDVVFVHDGSETTAASFDFAVQDTGADGAAATNATFSMTAVPTNDAPHDIHLSDKDISERDGAGKLVGTLTTSDVDLPGDVCTYSILNDPSGAFIIVGNQLMLDGSVSFGAFPTVDLVIQTDDGNGGIFDRILTIDVERVDDGNVRIPTDPNFGDVGRGLLEEERGNDDGDSSPIIQNFINGSPFDGNAYYGETKLSQIIRENTTFEIASLLNNNPSQQAINHLVEAESFQAPISEDVSQETQGHYTRMVDFLKSTEEFSGEETPIDAKDQQDNAEKDLKITGIEDEFDNMLNYHEQRAQNLIKALMQGENIPNS